MNLLAINFNHDGAAVVLRDGDIAGYVNTERFSRRKKHPGVRACDIENVLDQAGIKLSAIDLVQLVNLNNMDSPDIPQLHGSNLKETWPSFWIDGTFSRVRLLDQALPCVVVSSEAHHTLHAAAAYYFSPFDSAVVFACDPIGAGAYFMKGNRALASPPPRNLVAPMVYQMAAERVFGNGLIGAGKLMGLAPYGSDAAALHLDYEYLAGIGADGAYAELLQGARKVSIEIEEGEGALDASLAYLAQEFLEFELARMFRDLYHTAMELGIDANLCLSGGTALNSVANQRAFRESPFERLYLHPACGDDGTAIGAALLHWHLQLGQPRKKRSNRQAMYSCRSYDHLVPEALRRNRARLEISVTADSPAEAAGLIASGKVVGWFQGSSEIGPRALGNRSILADPRNPTMKDHLNRNIKQREGFRPFAPSVLTERAGEWLDDFANPFMLRVGKVKSAAVPAVTHVDGTARFQTVEREDNPRYYELITRFFELTGVPLVLNTSFNGKGEPIVETPDDAIDCLLAAKLDAVVFPGFIVTPRATSSVA